MWSEDFWKSIWKKKISSKWVKLDKILGFLYMTFRVDNRYMWINISLDSPRKNKTIIMCVTDCLQKYIRLINHGRFCFVLPSKRLINPIYFCSKSVTNLIRTDIRFKLITKSYLSHHKTVFIKANFLFLFNDKFARGIFIG